LTLLPTLDHEADYRAHLAQAERLHDALVERDDLTSVIEGDWGMWPAPTVRIYPKNGAWDPRKVRAELAAGDPPIHIDAPYGTLRISTHGLLPGQELVIAERIDQLLNAMAGEK
jgi:hypothetical protein